MGRHMAIEPRPWHYEADGAEMESTLVPTPGEWTAEPLGFWKQAIVADEHRHIAIVENDVVGEREHVVANAQLMAAAPRMLEALKAVDAQMIGAAMNHARARGLDVSWERLQRMLGVNDLHAQVREAIQAAERGR